MMGGDWRPLNFLLLDRDTQMPALCCPSETPEGHPPQLQLHAVPSAGFPSLTLSPSSPPMITSLKTIESLCDVETCDPAR